MGINAKAIQHSVRFLVNSTIQCLFDMTPKSIFNFIKYFYIFLECLCTIPISSTASSQKTLAQVEAPVPTF